MAGGTFVGFRAGARTPQVPRKWGRDFFRGCRFRRPSFDVQAGPELLRIQRRLTPVAAAGLTILMSGATVLTVATASGGAAAIPALVGLLAAAVAYGRWPTEVRSAPTGQHPHAVR